jgi:hypothetical protein
MRLYAFFSILSCFSVISISSLSRRDRTAYCLQPSCVTPIDALSYYNLIQHKYNFIAFRD